MMRHLLGAIGLRTALVPDQIGALFEAIAVKIPTKAPSIRGSAICLGSRGSNCACDTP